MGHTAWRVKSSLGGIAVAEAIAHRTRKYAPRKGEPQWGILPIVLPMNLYRGFEGLCLTEEAALSVRNLVSTITRA